MIWFPSCCCFCSIFLDLFWWTVLGFSVPFWMCLSFSLGQSIPFMIFCRAALVVVNFLIYYIPKCNLFGSYNATCLHVFRADHLALDSQLVCSSLGREGVLVLPAFPAFTGQRQRSPQGLDPAPSNSLLLALPSICLGQYGVSLTGAF